MASLWDSLGEKMDAAVDMIGDDISYSTSASGAFQTVKGFVLPVGASQSSVDFIDEAIDQKPRVKLNKSLVAKPGPNCRLRHTKLGVGTFRPLGVEDDLTTQGRYWIFDVERVSKT